MMGKHLWKYDEYELPDNEEAGALGGVPFFKRKKQAIQIAHDLGYSKGVIQKLKKCCTESQISNVMKSAREDPFEWRENV